jgi:alpha-beta hydrolase superfamily lysophospholipase
VRKTVNKSIIDNPLILTILFHPRSAVPLASPTAGKTDGYFSVDDTVRLGYRFYRQPEDRVVILYFHGNGEIAADHDGIASLYHQIGASLLVVDYRGYGWSTGAPLVSTLLPDVEGIPDQLSDVLRSETGAKAPLFVMGRSLGSACAIHLAHKNPDTFKGLILESGFGDVQPLLSRLGLPLGPLKKFVQDPIANVSKMGDIRLPTLIIHGERDNLIPISNGETLYDACPAEGKRLVRIPGAGHNDLLFVGRNQYFTSIQDFISAL